MSQEVTPLDELLKTFTADQLKYIAVRPFVRYDYQAAEQIGISRETVGRWDNKADVDEAVKLMVLDGVHVAGEILSRNVAKAASEIASELDHKSVNIRRQAAVEILDRVTGKSAQPIELSFDLDEWKRKAQKNERQMTEAVSDE